MIERIRQVVTSEEKNLEDFIEASTLAQTVLHHTSGEGHPAMSVLKEGMDKRYWPTMLGGCRTVLMLFDNDALDSPRLRVARELEGDVLDIAETQVRAAEKILDPTQKEIRLAVAGFLAGSALEDALRRLCDKVRVSYEAGRTSLSKLQAALYSPSSGVEHVSVSEAKQITTWGDTRNKADHGNFREITQTEVVTMIMGVRSFIERHL